MAPSMLIAGNWKMNGLRAEAATLATAIVERMDPGPAGCEVAVCPPFTVLGAVAEILAGSPVTLGGQDCHAEPEGAYTGSVSAEMLADLGCRWVIVGHSERRHGLGEDDAAVLAKATAALRARLTPIVCVGETLAQRDAGETLAVVDTQIAGSVPRTGARVVVAYEPVWAIGSGRVPTVEEIGAVHRHIRERLTSRREDGARVPILYGGSAKPDNAAELLAADEVGGLLIGGASLDAAGFCAMIEAGAGAAGR